YASGGAEMALMTVQDLLDINVDYFMQINMQGLVDLVNAVGGITVTNKFDFPISIAANEPEYKAVVEPGTHKINGEQALVYSRMR
ncbi:LCP family protein, partial [Streptococcus suis]